MWQWQHEAGGRQQYSGDKPTVEQFSLVSSEPVPAGTSGFMRFCVGGECATGRPGALRLVGEAGLAGLGSAWAALTGVVDPDRAAEFAALVEEENRLLQASRLLEGLPTPIMVRSTPESLRYFVWEPAGAGPHPCVIFLHGFGGLLGAYLNVMVESGLGRKFVIVAPALDLEARWWSPAGIRIVAVVIDKHLPTAVDRKRVFLLGLSNGAVGAAHMSSLPGFARRLAGYVLLSGYLAVKPHEEGARFLVLLGDEDGRFKLEGLLDAEWALQEAGARVETFLHEGNHNLILSHKHQWPGVAEEWMTR